MKKILVVGSANLDWVVQVPSTPIEGETVLADALAYLPGGKGANQACACGKLGAAPTFLSALGRDNQARPLLESLQEAGVNCERIRQTADHPTGLAFICVNRAGNNSIVVVPGANSACDAEYLQQNDAAFAACDILLVQMEIPIDAVAYAVKRAKALGKLVILNPAPATTDFDVRLYPQLDYITPNETELAKLTGVPVYSYEDVVRAAGMLLDWGAKNVLVTLGAKGCALVGPSGHQLFHAPDIAVKDTTGAGDTFNAAFTVGLAGGKSPTEAIGFANLAATLSVSRAGAQASMPTLQEVLAFERSIQ